jgi:hypothetical protein
VSVQDVIGISGALARIGEIQGLISAGARAEAAAAQAPVPAVAASFSSPSPGGFADALSLAQGVGGFAPAGAAQSVAQIPGASEMAAQIDEWIARKNPDSPLKGYGAVFVREGLANGVDPRALAAIARAESSLGTDPGARSINNAFGWGPHRPFASWEENIATVAAGLKKGYLDEGLVTLAQIQQKYCPVGAANDPMGLNSNWLRNTTLLYAELGGDPAGSVAVTPSGAATGTV